ncbi:hypothetical protein ACFL3S_11310, partial [Gemmatimonadota bacterium]
REPLHWTSEPRNVDLWELKGLLERIAPMAIQEAPEVSEGVPGGVGSTMYQGFVQSEVFALSTSGGTPVGVGGRIEPGKMDVPAWAGPVFGMEIALPSELQSRPSPVFQPLPSFPGVDRDLALVLPRDLPASRAAETIRRAGGALLAHLVIFDLYEGEGIPEGYRSVGFRLRFQSAERTLTDGEVDEAMDAVIDRLREELGVKTRG